MGTYTSVTALRLAQRARFERVGVAMVTVHKELATRGWKDMRENTRGSLTSKQLRAMGHPFGRIAGAGSNSGGRGIVKNLSTVTQGTDKRQVSRKGGVRPLPINRQTGQLYRGIRLDGPTGRSKVYRLYSIAPHASFVLHPDGTRRMISRGLKGPRGLLRKRHRARLAAAVDVVRKQNKR